MGWVQGGVSASAWDFHLGHGLAWSVCKVVPLAQMGSLIFFKFLLFSEIQSGKKKKEAKILLEGF